MRLMNPSPGECCDRLTILQLKIEAAKKKEGTTDLVVAQFQHEMNSIDTYLKYSHYTIPSDLFTEMNKINSRLWDLEDTQRNILSTSYESTFMDSPAGSTFLENAITILRLNDARAETVQKINAANNINQVEKIYSV